MNEQNKILALKYSALKCFKNVPIQFGLIIMFTVSTFFLSNEDTFKIASMNMSSIVTIIMLVAFLLNSIFHGALVLKKHPVQLPLFFLFLWALISLFIAKTDPSKAVPIEAYSYEWATGLNSPEWRGVSFLLRLFLSIIAIEFIISNIKTQKQYFIVTNILILLYSLICAFGLIQIILYGLFNVEIGKIILTPGVEGYFRIGGYVGEPQTFGLLLVGGLFIVFATVKKNYKDIWFPGRYLRVLFLLAIINLLFTFSVSMIVAVFLTFMFIMRKNINKKAIILFALCCIVFLLVYYETIYTAILEKLLHELSTINERTITWVFGTSMAIDNPITGVGIGQSPLVVSAYIPDVISKGFESILFYDKSRQTPMNTYIEWTAETGFIGILILGYVFYKTITMMARNRQYLDELAGVGYGSALLAFAIAANSSSGNFYTGLFSLIFGMYIAGRNDLKTTYTEDPQSWSPL